MKHLLSLLRYFKRKPKEKEEEPLIKDPEPKNEELEYPHINPCMPIMPPDFYEYDL